jgi:hypothetical protein
MVPVPISKSIDPAIAAPPWAPRLRAWLWVILFVAGLCLLRQAALTVRDGPAGFAIVYPASGLLAYGLLVSRRRLWPIIVSSAAVIGIAGSLALGRTLLQAVAFNGGATAGVAIAAWLVVRLSGRPTLRTLRGTFVLVLAPAVAMGVTSVASYALLTAAGASFSARAFSVFWAGSTLGILLAASLLVSGPNPARRRRPAPGRPSPSPGSSSATQARSR